MTSRKTTSALDVLSAGPTHFVNALGYRVQEMSTDFSAFWIEVGSDEHVPVWHRLSKDDCDLYGTGFESFDDPEIAFEVYDDDA